MKDKFDNVSQSERERLQRDGDAASEAARVGQRGFAPTKRGLERALSRQTRDEKLKALRDSIVVDPSRSSAALSLQGLDINENADFDDGVRIIKRHIRVATSADNIVRALQDEALESHNVQQRHRDGRLLGLPFGVAELLQENWNVLPHAFATTLMHTRGSFPTANKVVGAIVSVKSNVWVSQEYRKKLQEFRNKVHAPAYHDSQPKATKEAARKVELPCNVAGFCLHAAAGLLIRAMHAQLQRVIVSTRFPKINKEAHDLYDTNGIVLCALAERPMAPAGADGAAGAVLAKPVITKWVHVGACDRAPRAFFGHLLHLQVGQSSFDHESIVYEINLVGDWIFESSWQFCRFLDKELVWHLRFSDFRSLRGRWARSRLELAL
jgi:hypothetical protein